MPMNTVVHKTGYCCRNVKVKTIEPDIASNKFINICWMKIFLFHTLKTCCKNVFSILLSFLEYIILKIICVQIILIVNKEKWSKKFKVTFKNLPVNSIIHDIVHVEMHAQQLLVPVREYNGNLNKQKTYYHS